MIFEKRVATLLVILAFALAMVGCGGTGSPTPAQTTTPPPSTTPPAAPTASISVNPTTVVQGSSATLTWQTTNATSVSIDALGTVQPNGSQSVTPAGTTTYTLTAKGAGGTQTAAATVTITAPPPPPPPPPPSPPPTPSSFDVTILQPLPGATESSATAINDSGVIVGYSAFESRDNSSFSAEATMWVNGVATDLGVGIATAINSSGQVAGFGEPGPVFESGSSSQGWFWSPSTGRIPIGFLIEIGENTMALGIDDNGTVVGQAFSNGGPSRRAVTWSQSAGLQAVPTMQILNAIHVLSTNGSSGNSAMAGTSAINDQAAILTLVNGLPVITDLGATPNTFSSALAVNQLNSACGYIDTDQSQIEAFEWTQFQGFIELGTGGTRYSSALAMNDFGEIVGLTGDTQAGMVRLRSRFQGQLTPRPHDLGASFERAMIWTDGIGLQNLNTFVASSDWTLGAGNGINNKGEIVGTAFNSAQVNQAFVLEPK